MNSKSFVLAQRFKSALVSNGKIDNPPHGQKLITAMKRHIGLMSSDLPPSSESSEQPQDMEHATVETEGEKLLRKRSKIIKEEKEDDGVEIKTEFETKDAAGSAETAKESLGPSDFLAKASVQDRKDNDSEPSPTQDLLKETLRQRDAEEVEDRILAPQWRVQGGYQAGYQDGFRAGYHRGCVSSFWQSNFTSLQQAKASTVLEATSCLTTNMVKPLPHMYPTTSYSPLIDSRSYHCSTSTQTSALSQPHSCTCCQGIKVTEQATAVLSNDQCSRQHEDYLVGQEAAVLSNIEYSSQQEGNLVSTDRERSSPTTSSLNSFTRTLSLSETGVSDLSKYEETDESFGDFKEEAAEYKKKLKELPRCWETLFSGRKQQQQVTKSKHVEFTVMSYNILSQDLLETHRDLYSNSSLQSLDWENRRRRLVAEIACHSPDILNLQEVHAEHFNGYILPRLKSLGYGGVYQKRTGGKSDGCATMWKKDKFQMLCSTPVSFQRGGLLDRDNIAIITELKPIRKKPIQASSEIKPEEDKIVVANTHLLFNPRRGDIKLAQLMVLMAEIDRHAYLGLLNHDPYDLRCRDLQTYLWAGSRPGHYCPVILTGDFNMEPQSELYKFVVSGLLNYEGLLVRQISGQEEGRYGRNLFLDKHFFSPMYGVTDSCQYHTSVVSRLQEMYMLSTPSELSDGSSNRHWPKENREPSSSSSSSSPKKKSRLTSSKGPPSHDIPFSTGYLWHHLNLISAYRHKLERLGFEDEVTTYHNRARCSVDYIFFSVNKKEVYYSHDGDVRLTNIQSGRLRLLARYSLMSAREIDERGSIPSPEFPSDHLCLIAKFILN